MFFASGNFGADLANWILGFPHQQRQEEDQCWPRLRLTVLEGLADAHLADEVGPSTEARASWLPGLAQDDFTCEGHARCVSHVGVVEQFTFLHVAIAKGKMLLKRSLEGSAHVW